MNWAFTVVKPCFIYVISPRPLLSFSICNANQNRKGFIYSTYTSPYIHIQWQRVISWPSSSSVISDNKNTHQLQFYLNRLTVIWKAETKQQTWRLRKVTPLITLFEGTTLMRYPNFRPTTQKDWSPWIQASFSMRVLAGVPLDSTQNNSEPSLREQKKKDLVFLHLVLPASGMLKFALGEACSTGCWLIVGPFV